MADLIPLLHPYRENQPLVWRDGESVNQAEFIERAITLAKALPRDEFLINLCHDRYFFLLTFCAALIQGSTNLLPPNRQLTTIRELMQRYPGSHCVSDSPELFGQLESLTVLNNDALFDIGGNNSGGINRMNVSIPKIDAEHTAAMAFTSGSTGQPSANAKLWKTLVGTGRKLATRFKFVDTPTVVATVPSQHMYGLEMTVMQALQGSCVMAAAHPFFPADVIATLHQARQQSQSNQVVLVTTPVHLRSLTGSMANPEAIDLIVSATAKLSPESAAQAESLFACDVCEIYGCTEAGSMATRRTLDGDRWMMLDGMWVREDNGEFVAGGDQLNRAALLQDQLEIKSSMEFCLLGRSTDMINVAGKRSSLAELTQRMLDIEGVEDAVVFLPQKNSTENHSDESRPAAAVVCRLSLHELQQKMQAVIDPVFVPRPIYLVENIARNETGKVTAKTLAGFVD